jgi:SAM-dependent methyltransferase
MSPAAEPAWLDPSIVAGFVAATPNSRLIDYAGRLSRGTPLAALDIGCGAGRNAVPLARSGANVIGTDLSWPMLTAAAARDAAGRLHLARAPMHALPIRSQSMDLIIAHGIWNLARSGAEFRQAVREAARCAVPGARLFVFTFSRRTLAAEILPVAGVTFVFTQFSGTPQVFLTDGQLHEELAGAGFDPDPDLPLREHNLPLPGQVRIGGAPIIYEAGFRRRGV